MKKVMITGHFDPLHEDHIAYFRAAASYGDYVICLMATDKQATEKKGKVNIPQHERLIIVDLVLTGLQVPHTVVSNIWDASNTTLVNTLNFWHPDILLRGKDKTPQDMPDSDEQLCKELGIKVEYVTGTCKNHSRDMLMNKEEI